MQRPKRIYGWTLALWAVAVVAHLVWFVVAASTYPPTDEAYTRLTLFQPAAFAVTRLPYWLGGLLVLLIAEFFIFGRASRAAEFRRQ